MLLLTPTRIGQMFRPALSGRTVNKYLQELGLQKRVHNEWMITEEGKKYCSCFSRQLENGKMIYQVKWKTQVRDMIQNELNRKFFKKND